MINWKRSARSILVALSVLLSINMAAPPAAEAFLISTQQEIDMGRSFSRELEKKFGLVNDPELQARVARIGASIAAVADRKDLPYSFKVLNSKEVNAMAVPGGYIYVFKGLTDYMPSDTELAGILGHEVGHIVKKHTVVQIERSLAVGVVFAVLMGSSSSLILAELISDALMAGYSREAEREADSLGVVHTMRAGYNPYSMLIGMEKLDQLSGKTSFDLFADHPETSKRIIAVRDQILNNYKVRPMVKEEDNYAQVIDGQWSLPTFNSSYAGYSPRMRAYLTAGRIYRLMNLPDYSSDKLYVNDLENATAIYYNDEKEPIAVITEKDAAANGFSQNDMAQMIIQRLRERAGR